MNKTVRKHQKSTIRIKDEKFNVDDIGSYDLVLFISHKNFKCSVVSEKLGRVVYFENFDFTKEMDQNAVLEQLEIIFEEHHILQAGFWNTVRVVLSDEFFTLVPKDFFNEKRSSDILSFNYPSFDGRSKDGDFFKPNSGPAVSVFSVPKKYNTFLKQFYKKKKIHYLHEFTSVLEGIITWGGASPKITFSAYISDHHITVICIDKGKIRFFNTFDFREPEDAVYYILSVMEQFDIRGAKSQIDFYGNIDENSALVKTADKYIGNVKMGERPKLFYFNYEFDEIPSQWHFETFCAYLCK